LDDNRADRAIGAIAWAEAIIKRAIGIQPGDATARHAVEGREIPTNQNLAITLHRNRINRIIGPGAWVESRIDPAVLIKTSNIIAVSGGDDRELTAYDYFLVRLQGHG